MENCDRHIEDIQLVLESEKLGLEGMEEFEIHLAECRVCNDVYREFQVLFAGLDCLPF